MGSTTLKMRGQAGLLAGPNVAPAFAAVSQFRAECDRQVGDTTFSNHLLCRRWLANACTASAARRANAGGIDSTFAADPSPDCISAGGTMSTASSLRLVSTGEGPGEVVASPTAVRARL